MTQSRLQIWIMAARPKTLPAAVAPVLIGSSMAWADGGFHLPAALVAAIGALLIQIGTNFANDYFDYKKGTDSGERLGPTRVTQAGLVSPQQMKGAIVILFALALLSGVYLVYRGGWPVVAIGLLSILFGVLYTGGPFPLGYNGLGELFVFVFFGPVAVGGTYYVQTLDISAAVLVAGCAPGLFSVAILTVNNLRDLEPDRKAGKKTIPTLLGRKFAIAFYSLIVVAACHTAIVLWSLFDAGPYVLLAMGTLFLSMPVTRKVATLTGAALNDCLASTGKLLLVYSFVFSITWLL